MRRLLITLFIALAMSLLPASASAANHRIFSEVANLPGVESVYIGPAAMRIAMKSLPDTKSLTPGIGAAIRELKSIEVIECDNRKSFDKIDKFARELVDRLSFEIIIEANDDDEKTRIYGIVPDSDSEVTTINALLIETRDNDEYTLVYVKGTIDLTDLDINSL